MPTFLESLERTFAQPAESLRLIAAAFAQAMREGLAGRPSPLRMLPSFIAVPTGREQGSALAIDFGGTNVRVLEAELDGHGNVVVHQMRRLPLIDPKGAYNHVCAQADAEGLFGFIAERLGELAKPGVGYPLGHTFSFPCEQRSLTSASLLVWTKEFRTRGVEGRDVGALLDEALAARGLGAIRGRAIINDTVGTLLAAAYGRHHVDVASICGTGHNTCYLEPRHPRTGAPMIVNMESGNFDGVAPTRFDAELDAQSERPGAQRLEKMCSGHYLGELVRRVLAEASSLGLLPAGGRTGERGVLGGEQLSLILDDEEDLPDTAAVAAERLGWAGTTREQRVCIQKVVTLVARRSARLVAATFAGTLAHVDPEARRPHVVAVDGSLYEKLPGYAVELQRALDELVPGPAGRVSTMLAKDGSGLGAAIAAVVAGGR